MSVFNFANDGDGVPDQMGFDSNYGYSFIDPIIHAWGGRTLTPDLQQVVLDQPEAVAAVQYLVDLIWEHGVAPEIGNRSQFGFNSGRLGMYVETTNPIAGLWDTASFDWNVQMMPIGRAKRAVRLWPDSFSIPTDADNPDVVWEFIKFAITTWNPYANARNVLARRTEPARGQTDPQFCHSKDSLQNVA